MKGADEGVNLRALTPNQILKQAGEYRIDQIQNVGVDWDGWLTGLTLIAILGHNFKSKH